MKLVSGVNVSLRLVVALVHLSAAHGSGDLPHSPSHPPEWYRNGVFPSVLEPQSILPSGHNTPVDPITKHPPEWFRNGVFPSIPEPHSILPLPHNTPVDLTSKRPPQFYRNGIFPYLGLATSFPSYPVASPDPACTETPETGGMDRALARKLQAQADFNREHNAGAALDVFEAGISDLERLYRAALLALLHSPAPPLAQWADHWLQWWLRDHPRIPCDTRTTADKFLVYVVDRQVGHIAATPPIVAFERAFSAMVLASPEYALLKAQLRCNTAALFLLIHSIASTA